MVHKDDFGNLVGTPAEWEMFYKWAEKNGKLDKPCMEGIEEYLKLNGK